MTSISHALIGAAIAAKVTDPVTAGCVAFGLHFLCDAIPHWDLGTNWRLRPRAVTGSLAIAETLVGVFGTFLLFQYLVPNQLVLIIAIVTSLLPDWLEAPYYMLMPHAPKFFYYIYKMQSKMHNKLQAPWGIVTQVVVAGLFLVWGFVL